MRRITTLVFTICALAVLLPAESKGEPFTNELSIVAMSRANQSNALKVKFLKKELGLIEVITVLTTYKRLSKLQYMVYAHQMGVNGTVTLKDGKTYKWSIESGYAATVKDDKGEKVYLLHPKLKTEPKDAEGKK